MRYSTPQVLLTVSPFLSSPRSGITVSPRSAKSLSLQATYFQHNTHSFAQRRQPIPRPFNHLRTLLPLTTKNFSPLLKTSNPQRLTPVFATHPKNAPVTPFLATLPNSLDLKRDYILDTKPASCYAFFMVDLFNFATCFLTCFTTLGWNKCLSSSSLVMFFGCFFFFGMVTL